jgi:hypothetical protein
VTVDVASLDILLDYPRYSTSEDPQTYVKGASLATITTNVLSNLDLGIWGITRVGSTGTNRALEWKTGQTATSFLTDAARSAGRIIYGSRAGAITYLDSATTLTPPASGSEDHQITNATILSMSAQFDSSNLTNMVVVRYSDGVTTSSLTGPRAPTEIGRRAEYLSYSDSTAVTLAGAAEASELLDRVMTQSRLYEVEAISHYPLAARQWVRLNALGEDRMLSVESVTFQVNGTMRVVLNPNPSGAV